MALPSAQQLDGRYMEGGGGGSEGKSGPGEGRGTLIVPERGPLGRDSEPVCDPGLVISLSECFLICLEGIRNAPETAKWTPDAILHLAILHPRSTCHLA